MRAPVQETKANGRDLSSRGLIESVVVDAQRLFALEVALARQEAKELATANGVAGAIIALGGLLTLLGVFVAVPVLVLVGRSRLQLRLPRGQSRP